MPTPLSMNWSAQGADETSIAGGFTQNTGGINVGVTYFDDGLGTQFDVETSTPQYVGAGEPMATNSALELRSNGSSGGTQDSSTTRIDFGSVSGSGYSSEVENVIFRINDAGNNSWGDVLTVRAYDANDVQIDVTLTYQGATQTATDPSVTGAGGNVSASTASGSILVNIPGPVAYFEIDYDNSGTGAQALWVTDIHFDAIELDGTVEGTSGADVIDSDYIGDPDGDKIDDGDAILPGHGSNDDLIYAYGGADTVLAGSGNDTVYAGSGNDSVSGGAGNDEVYLGGGSDTFGDWSTEGGNDTVYGGGDADSLNGGAGDDTLFGDSGNDTLTGATGNDTLYGGDGNDTFLITDDHDGDIIVGGEDVGDGDFDYVNFSNFTSSGGVTVTATGDEEGSYDFDGTTAAGTYSEIEGFGGSDNDDTFNLGADNSGVLVDAWTGDDSITTGSGDDTIIAGPGADTINAGGGNDQIDLGEDSPGVTDGDPDLVILEDGFGDDIITNLDAPTPNGDGTFTGTDTFDVTNLTDAGGDPVNTHDVTVTNDGSGNAVLTFPNGESVTLNGIDPTDADNPFYLNALGIPMPDGTVEGTSGADTIDAGYTGDPDGDMVDSNDAILPGDTGDDDLIYAYGGDDNIYSGAGNDEVYGGDGDDLVQSGGGNSTLYGGADNDTINSGSGNDTVFGGTGDDTFLVSAGAGTDLIEGGEDVGDGDIDTLTFSDFSGPDGVSVTMTGDEAGTYEFPTTGGTGTFSEIEEIELTDNNDIYDGTLATGGSTIDGGAGDDILIGSSGQDDLSGGDGDDELVGGAGNDTLTGGDGADTLTGGADQDVIYGGAGDSVDGSETGVDNDTMYVSDVDYIDYDSGNPENGTIYFNGGGSLVFTNIENVIVADRDGTVSGTAGNDTIDASYTGDPDGDQVDNNDAILIGDSGNDDLIEAGAGADTILAGAGDDEVYAGTGDDIVTGGTGDDTLFGEDGSDTFVLGGFSGSDDIFGGEDGDGTDIDALDFLSIPSGGATVIFDGDESGRYDIDSGSSGTGFFDEIEAVIGSDVGDYVEGRDNTESMTIFGNGGDDTIVGGSGDDVLSGGDGDDLLALVNGFGNDTITGGETGETDGDTLNASLVTDNLTVDLETLSPGNPENGTITDGTGTTTFSEIENIILGSGDDSVTGSAGSENIDLGSGADTIEGGAGDDAINLGDDGAGNPDGDGDVMVLEDGFGNDTVTNFDAPTPNGDGTFTGIDTVDVTNLTDGTDPVNTNDVTVTDDGSGNAVLTFPNGESITLLGIDPVDADNPFYLNAIGIPLPDGTVSGTAGNDTINGAYTGDPDGDLVDNNDAILAGDSGNDDLIEAGAGNDTVTAGGGQDEVYGGTGSDTLYGDTGDDTLFGEAGNDSLYGGTGADTLYGGTGDDELFMRDGDDTSFGGAGDDTFLVDAADGTNVVTGGETDETEGDTLAVNSAVPVTVLASGDEAGTLTTGTTTVNFSEIENLETGTGNDTVNIEADTTGIHVSTFAGSDTVIGGSGADDIYGGSGDDALDGNAGADSLYGGAGNDTITFAEGDTASGGSGDDLFVLEDLGEPTNGTITVDGGFGSETGGDTLQLGGLTNLTQAVRDTFVDDGTGSYSGSVTLDDGTILNFSEIENIICFTPGTRIATPRGLVAIEDLRVNDKVVTRDHGLQPIRWIESRTVPAVDRFTPVRISKNVLSGQDRDLIVSPQHCVLFQGYRAELLFGESEVLVAAKHLVDGLDVTQNETGLVTYIHMMFDQHEIIYAEGAATESFHPGEIGFSAVADEAREELFAIFPDLRSDQSHYGSTARRCLKKHEAQLLYR